MRTRRTLLSTAVAAVLAAAPIGAASAEAFPDTIPIPTGSLPEGIATGAGTSIYAGSRLDGSVWMGDLRTGEGDVLVEGVVGERMAVGIKVERGLLFVSGGNYGDAYVYDARTGDEVATFELTDAAAFINDVTVTRDAAYFTNSFTAELYRVALGPAGVPTGEFETIPLSGAWDQVPGFNANGIAATPDGKTLLIVNSTSGILYNVDPMTGEAVAVDADTSLTQGDGILLRGKTLYVVRNRSNEVVELRMSSDFLSATHVATMTDPDFNVPTTIAMHGSRLYAVNAKFGDPPGPTTEHEIVLVDGE